MADDVISAAIVSAALQPNLVGLRSEEFFG
jgi:hypothetical protein